VGLFGIEHTTMKNMMLVRIASEEITMLTMLGASIETAIDWY
jgi:hypothetical protein